MRRLAKSKIALLLILVLVTAGWDNSCGSKNPLTSVEGVNKVEDKLSQVNNGLNALAKANRELYRDNVISLTERRTTAGIINTVNVGLRKVADRVYEIDPNNPESIRLGKIDVVTLLEGVNRELAKVNFGPSELRLAAQVVISLTVEAISLTRQIREVSNVGNTNK
jgi:hypothetical protein